MKKIILTCFVFFLLASCGSEKSVITRTLKETEKLDLNLVTDEIQRQYILAIEDLEKEGIKNVAIESAELSLTVTQTIGTSGGLEIPIFNLSGSRERSSSTSVTFILSKDSEGGGSVKNFSADNLRSLIVAAAKKCVTLKRTIANLNKKSFSLEITFSIKSTGGGKFSIEIWGVGASIGAEKSGETEHSLKLNFDVK